MKNFSIKYTFLFLFFAFIGISNAQNTSILLDVRNIEILEGKLFVSLSSDSLQFTNFTNPVNSQIRKIEVKSSNETLIFKNLSPGWYAIAVFQDLNANDSLDTKKYGIPVEPFGFSNDALARFRPPSFKAARFYIAENIQIKQVINLVYRKPKNVPSQTVTK